MIRIQQLKLLIPHDDEAIRKRIKKQLRLNSNQPFQHTIVRRSLDARKKPDLYYSYVVDVDLENPALEQEKLRRLQSANLFKAVNHVYEFPQCGEKPLKTRPVIIGSGPAGLFCALMLARRGFAPIVLERGAPVEERKRQVEHFWKEGVFDPASNVQFGEGGAGTFSDGKLNTLVKDASGRNRKVLSEFVKAGANSDILYENKPHIGTDELIKIVRAMREEIISLGGEVRFCAKATDFLIENNHICAVEINGKEWLNASQVVMAIGHSARDTFSLLKEKGVHMQQKAFALGVRIEHPQSMINLAQYGREHAPSLGAADYKLTAKDQSGRGVYTFCMCPGGYVVNASSEEKRLAINGMSYSKRDAANANSALLVTVDERDFGSDDALAGVWLQRRLEERAYEIGSGSIPVQLFEDFRKGKESAAFGDYSPCIKGRYSFGNVRAIFPDSISMAIERGILQFDKKIHGFARNDAILSGVESRSSSPVRIVRDDALQSNIRGLYPCGEGAGYAGGITSAAMDGIKIAERIAMTYKLV